MTDENKVDQKTVGKQEASQTPSPQAAQKPIPENKSEFAPAAKPEIKSDDRKDSGGTPEHMKIDLNEPGFDLNPLQDPKDFIRKRFVLMPKASPDEVADTIIGLLTQEGKEVLLKDLVQDVVLRLNKSITPEAYMDERNPDPNGYPYLHGYNRKLYRKQLAMLQVELLKLESWIKETGQKIIVIFEGRDAAGKGETIQRFLKNMNPHGARVAATPVPTQAQEGQWFFQRYVSQLPSPGEIVFFDRSWYNRAVVDPVMGFCTPEQTEIFFKDVPYFERSLMDAGIILMKFWLDVGREEQKHRFKLRKFRPLKTWKLSPVDLSSMNKWDQYSEAIERMFQKTNSYPAAPWTVIRTDDKLRGRINSIRYVLLHLDYPGKDLKMIGEVDPLIVYPATQYGQKGVGMVHLEEKVDEKEAKYAKKKSRKKHKLGKLL